MDINVHIAKIIADVLDNQDAINFLLEQNDLTNINLNSISFIKIIVNIENEFDIEFDDDVLNYKSFQTFTELCEYIDKLIKKRSETGV